MDYKGFFITFEGADGCGKTTQMEKLSKYLDKNKIDYIITRDPGGTELGNQLREILLHHEGFMSSTCETFLYLADRAQHIEDKIIPALKEGKIVLCDRHIDSTVAYQGYARGLDIDELITLNKIATKNILPDLTIVYDIDTETASKRVGKDKDRLEAEGKEFHKKVRDGYLKLAEKFPDRIKVIDSTKTIDEVAEETKDILWEAMMENDNWIQRAKNLIKNSGTVLSNFFKIIFKEFKF